MYTEIYMIGSLILKQFQFSSYIPTWKENFCYPHTDAEVIGHTCSLHTVRLSSIQWQWSVFVSALDVKRLRGDRSCSQPIQNSVTPAPSNNPTAHWELFWGCQVYLWRIMWHLPLKQSHWALHLTQTLSVPLCITFLSCDVCLIFSTHPSTKLESKHSKQSTGGASDCLPVWLTI